MSTIGGALRARVVTSGIVSGRVFRDRAPDGCTFPYVTFTDPLSLVPDLSGDGAVLMRERQVSFDLWQKVREEDDQLLVALADAVDGVWVDLGDGRKAVRTRMTSLQRLSDPDALVVHHALTLTVKHQGV